MGVVLEHNGIKYRKMIFSLTNLLESGEITKIGKETIDIIGDVDSARPPLVIINQTIAGVFRMTNSENVANFPFDSHYCCFTVILIPSYPNHSSYYFGEITSRFIGAMPLLRNIEPIVDEWRVFTGSQIHYKSSENKVFYQMAFTIERKVITPFHIHTYRTLHVVY